MVQSLRFRLTVSYLVFFGILLVGVGVAFRGILQAILNNQVSALLEEEWGATKGYLSIEKKKPIWKYDDQDLEEKAIVEKLRQIYILADSNGNVMEVSDGYEAVGVERAAEIRQVMAANKPVTAIRRSPDGVPYMIRQGVLLDDNSKFYLAIGRPLAENERVLDQFTRNYLALLPVLLILTVLGGWYLARRALRPVTESAEATGRISGANLSYRLPLRGSGDELDKLVGTINSMLDRLEYSFTQTRQFSTDVSHELRTPLTVIRGQLEVGLMTARTPEQYREAIVNALQDVERLSHTVRALLNLSLAESGQLVLQKADLDFGALAREMAEQFQIAAEAEGMALEVSVTPGCLVSADRVQLERLMTNLLANALKFTPSGGRVTVRVRRDGAAAELTVSDTGRGIPPEHQPHIFNRFYRVPSGEADPERGLGLGLSFVNWIVKAHGGEIDVTSAPGQGASFRVRLPLAAPEPAQEAPENLVAVE